MEALETRSTQHSSEEPEPLRLLRTALGGGDWETARSAAELVAFASLPASAEGLQARAEALQELLNAARAGRAHLADSLARVSAARRFQGAAISLADDRQNLVDSTEI
jgi:hypothetical protein